MTPSPSDDEIEIQAWLDEFGVTREQKTIELRTLDTEKFGIRANVFLSEVEAYRYLGQARILSFSKVYVDGFGLWHIAVAKDSGEV